jgi:hypothetical protein
MKMMNLGSCKCQASGKKGKVTCYGLVQVTIKASSISVTGDGKVKLPNPNPKGNPTSKPVEFVAGLGSEFAFYISGEQTASATHQCKEPKKDGSEPPATILDVPMPSPIHFGFDNQNGVGTAKAIGGAFILGSRIATMDKTWNDPMRFTVTEKVEGKGRGTGAAVSGILDVESIGEMVLTLTSKPQTKPEIVISLKSICTLNPPPGTKLGTSGNEKKDVFDGLTEDAEKCRRSVKAIKRIN